ncbi:MAG: hypothetical protein AAF903_00795 [Pseudomonadota bacterium]
MSDRKSAKDISFEEYAALSEGERDEVAFQMAAETIVQRLREEAYEKGIADGKAGRFEPPEPLTLPARGALDGDEAGFTVNS